MWLSLFRPQRDSLWNVIRVNRTRLLFNFDESKMYCNEHLQIKSSAAVDVQFKEQII